MEIATDEELAGVSAHELAHLSESQGVQAGRIAGSLALYPLIFVKPVLQAGFMAEVGLLALCTLLAALPAKLRRRMEERADKIAAENEGQAGVYARLLEKMYCDSLIPAVLSTRQKTHPALYDRMLAAGLQPDYPRPAPPQRMNWTTGVLMVVFGVVWVLAMAR